MKRSSGLQVRDMNATEAPASKKCKSSGGAPSRPRCCPAESSAVRTFARVKPPQEDERGDSEVLSTGGTAGTSYVRHTGRAEAFVLDHVFGAGATQQEVFERCVLPQLVKFLSGYNLTLLLHGQTGSGKTHTMVGPRQRVARGGGGGGGGGGGPAEHDKGIIQRTLDKTFVLIKRASSGAKRYAVHVSMAEIVPSEHIYDLLLAGRKHECQLRESKEQQGFYLDGITEQRVASATEAAEVLHRGVANRCVAETAMNRDSSRSHMIFSLTVECTEETDGCKRQTRATFNMVDLAGSEDQRQTGSEGKVLDQAVGINSSLTVLGKVIRQVANGDPVPSFRESKLTMLLKNSIGGNSLTTLLTTLSSALASSATSLSTLRFAERAKKIQTKATRNENTERATEAASAGALQSKVAEQARRIHELELEIVVGGGGGGGAAQYAGGSLVVMPHGMGKAQYAHFIAEESARRRQCEERERVERLQRNRWEGECGE